MDFYQYVNFARQYFRRDVISRVLNNTILTRCFTVYQLADIVINQLPKVIQQYEAKLVVVSDLLDMFVRDPQIETNEATYLINEIVNSITRSKALEDVLVIVSLPFRNVSSNSDNVKPCISYNKMVHTRFDKSIEITDIENNVIDIKMRNNSKKTRDFCNGKFLSINKSDLLTVSAPTK
jgi:RNase H-fold protein (predicted Holliday junction resolvase)